MSKWVADETLCVFRALSNQRRYAEADNVLSTFEDATRQCAEAFPSHKSLLLVVLDAYDPSPESPILKVHREYIERREQYLIQAMTTILEKYK